jgi:hypothetical protein
MAKNYKMKDQGRDQGMSYLDRMAAMAEKQPQNRIAAEAARLQAAKAACSIPESCGPDIAPSPARGGFVLARQVELLPVGSEKVEAVHRGYGGRDAIQCADAFDAMLKAAARSKRPSPLTPGQISIGRRYRALVEMLAADDTKLSSLEATFGGGAGRDWMDRRLEFSAELDTLRARIGAGAAMVVRRVRPSARGQDGARVISDRALIDAVCLKGQSLKAVLRAHLWSDYGGNQKTLAEALSAALDRMIGYRPEKSS